MRIAGALILLMCGGLMLAPPAEARSKDQFRIPSLEAPDASEPHRIRDMRPRLTPADAAREAQARNGGGRVLSVSAVDGGYRVKLLKEGDMRVVFVSDH